jgi:CRP-like cAMP-binding protein
VLSVVERVIILQSVDVFSEVPSEQLAHVAAIAGEVSFAADETIFREHDPPDAMYVVLEGQVRLSRGRQVVTVAGVDEAFGTWALFDSEPRVVDAVSVGNSRLLRLSRDDFLDLLADSVAITEGVLKGIVMRLRGVAGRVNFERER